MINAYNYVLFLLTLNMFNGDEAFIQAGTYWKIYYLQSTVTLLSQGRTCTSNNNYNTESSHIVNWGNLSNIGHTMYYYNHLRELPPKSRSAKTLVSTSTMHVLET